MAWAAVFLTKGERSLTPSLIESNIIGTIIWTLILDNTLKALARINWFESYITQMLFRILQVCQSRKRLMEGASANEVEMPCSILE